MNTALAIRPQVDMWHCPDKLKEIRKFICSEPLTDVEWETVIQTARESRLNPFKKEIWVIKYRPKPNKYTGKVEPSVAQIFIGRDGYRVTAQRNPDYEYHQVNSIYSQDEFKVDNNGIYHSFGLNKGEFDFKVDEKGVRHSFGLSRGELIGAYCIVKRKSSSKETYVIVNMKEYNQQQGLWKPNEKPETMIKKVAEAQALRQSFQETLGNTLSDAEEYHYRSVIDIDLHEAKTQTQKLNNIIDYNTGKTLQDDSLKEESTDEPISDEQVSKIEALIKEKNLTMERIGKAYALYNISHICDLTDKQAKNFIFQLERIKCQEG